MSYLLQQLINGVQLGTIYALVALGYTMVYGIIRLINFAHADIFMVGAYIAFFVASFAAGATGTLPVQVWVWVALIAGYLLHGWVSVRWPPARRMTAWFSSQVARQQVRWRAAAWACAAGLAHAAGMAVMAAAAFPVIYYPTRLLFSLPLGWALLPLTVVYVMALCGLVGVAMERIAYRPLRYKARLSALITALGVSLLLENLCSQRLVFDSKYRAFPELVKKAAVVRIEALDITVSNMFVLNLAVAGALLAGLWFLVEKTLLGKQMRAVAFDKRAAALMGIDIDRVIAMTFFIGPALAGVSGILYAMNYGILQSPFLGFVPGMKAFIAAVLGGIGSLPGAVVGALLMGITEVMANSIDSNLGLATAFLILIAILLARPAGIMGRREVEKV